MFKTLAIALAIFAFVPLASADARGLPFVEHHRGEPPARADLARVYFYRQPGAFGGAVEPYILVDGYGVGVSRQGRYFYYDFAPGTHVVSAATEGHDATSVSLTAGQTVYVRFHTSPGLLMAHMNPELVGPDQGQKEIQDCDFDDDGMN
jgi:hypothetical protein